MKRIVSLFLAFLTSLAFAAPGDLEINQYDQFGIGRIPRLMTIPNGGASGILVYDGVTTWPRVATIGTGLSYSSGVLSASTPPLDFSQPTTRSLSVSTSYQATNTAKAAILYPSYACTNATTVLAASACTLQVRVGSSALTCSTGTVYYTQSLTVGLGLLITQNSTNPVPIFLPIGGHFIICPTAGTFTVTAVEQSAG